MSFIIHTNLVIHTSSDCKWPITIKYVVNNVFFSKEKQFSTLTIKQNWIYKLIPSLATNSCDFFGIDMWIWIGK